MFFKKKPTEIPRLLKEMEEHPENFTLYSDSCIIHKPSGIHYWFYGGHGHYGIWKPFEKKFHADDQSRFRKALAPLKKMLTEDKRDVDIPA